jgi:hypothetical protein
MFKDMQQQDSLELLCVLLDSIRTEEIGAFQALHPCASLTQPRNAGMAQSCQLKRSPNFIDDVFGGLTRSVVVCSRCCRPSIALERCMHTSVCFPTQLVDSLRPQRSACKNKNKSNAHNSKQGSKFKSKGNKSDSRKNQASNEGEELQSPRACAGRGSPETTPPPSAVKKKQFKNIKQQEREWQRQKKASKRNGGFSSFELLDEDAEEERRRSWLVIQKAKEDSEKQTSSEGAGAHNHDGGGSDDAASRGSIPDAGALDGDLDDAPFCFDLFEDTEDQKAVRDSPQL